MYQLRFIFAFCYFASFKILVGAQGSPNITLVRDANDAWCVAQGEEVFSGLTWNSFADPLVCLQEIVYPNKKHILEMDEGTKTNTIRNPLMGHQWDGLTDYRWNGMPVVQMSGENEFKLENNIPINFYQGNFWKLTISILSEKDAYIFLCEGLQPHYSRCYWIIIGGWANNKNYPNGRCALRKCPSGAPPAGNEMGWSHCQKDSDFHNNGITNLNEWKHITLIAEYQQINNRNNLFTQLQLKVLHDDKIILKDTDTSPYDLKYLNFRSTSSKTFFRTHNYAYSMGRKDQMLNSVRFIPQRTEQCWGIEYNFLTQSAATSLDMSVHYKSGKITQVQSLQATQGKWRVHEARFTLDERYKEGISFVFQGKQGNTFAVGNIRRCNVTPFTRVSSKLRTKEDVNCQSLKFPGQKVSLTSTIDKDYGDMNCGALQIIDLSSCKGVALCQITPHKTNVCFCSSGYHGPSCTMQYLILKKPPVSKASTSSSIMIEINDFEINGKGTPSECILQFVLSSDVKSESSWKTYATFHYKSPKTYNITGLEKGKEYAFRVVLKDKDGQLHTQQAPYSLFTACDRPQKGDIQVKRTNTSIQIHWEESGIYSCPITSYTFIVGSTEVNGMERLPIQVPYLEPNTKYDWKLLYKYSEMYQGEITTLPGVPSKVTELKILNTHPTGFRIQWQVPQKTYGLIPSYQVTYKHIKYKACQDENYDSKEMFHNTTHLYFDLEELKPFSTYVVSVAAFTIEYGDAVGRKVDTEGYETVNIQPHLDPNKDIKIKDTSVEVFWTVDCTAVKGLIKEYDVTLRGKSDWVKGVNKKRDWHQNRLSATFSELIPYTDYEVVVLPVGNSGSAEDQYALRINFTTDSTEPGQVKNFVAYSFGDNWISLRWEAPSPPLGKLVSYQVTLLGTTESKTINISDHCHLWKEMICTQFGNLEKETDYSIEVYAKSVKGSGHPSRLARRTREEVPDPPAHINAVALSRQEINVTWQHPNITRGKIRYFAVHAQLNSTGLKKNVSYLPITENITIAEDKLNYDMQIKDLLPTCKYTVDIAGVTVGQGNSNSVFAKTFIAVPDIGPHLKLKPKSVTNTSFQVLLPPTDQEFLTDSSAYIIIVTSADDREEHKRELYFNDAGTEMVESILNKTENDIGRISWVAAEVQPTNKEIPFEVGDNSSQKSGAHFVQSATNHELIPGGLYQVTLIALCAWDNEFNFSIAKLEQVLQIGVIQSSNAGDIVGWVILGLLLICIPVVLFFIIRRRKIKKSGDMIELKQEDVLAGNRDVSVDGITATPDLEEVSPGPKQAPSQRFSRKVAIADLEQYIKHGLASGELQRQHSLFPRGQTRPWEYGQLQQNKAKNRYGNLVAYDVTRVELKKLPDNPFSDYINANYIDGYKSPRFYIATQGPKRNTVDDFWRMIWQENVQVIAMMTNLFESGKLKCEKYWPEHGQEVTYGAVTVLTASNQIFADYTFRIFNVSTKGKTRKIHHLHFTSWPDHGVPLYTQSVASYIKKLLAVFPGSGPIVVHCSAGVGRTGTIILADICLRMAAAEGCVDVLSFLQHIREQRANMVDNLEQYKLVHMVLLECLVLQPSSYPCDANFENLVQELSSSGTIERQFKRLYERKWQDLALRVPSRDQISSSAQTDTSKNRNLNIVPSAHGQVHIPLYQDHELHSDYINAVYVDGFRAKDQFVVTQFPLQSTVGDFWRLIHEKNISLIVVLNEIDEAEEKSICKFWPQELGEAMTPVPYITLKKKTEDDSSKWKTHTLHVNATRPASASTSVRVLHLKGWKAEETLPPSPDVIIELWQEAERLYKGRQPMLICCLDGATASGFFVALAFLIEKIKLEQQCDVCQAVRTVRQNREQFVPTSEQFEFLYKAAISYLDSFQTYANFS